MLISSVLIDPGLKNISQGFLPFLDSGRSRNGRLQPENMSDLLFRISFSSRCLCQQLSGLSCQTNIDADKQEEHGD